MSRPPHPPRLYNLIIILVVKVFRILVVTFHPCQILRLHRRDSFWRSPFASAKCAAWRRDCRGPALAIRFPESLHETEDRGPCVRFCIVFPRTVTWTVDLGVRTLYLRKRNTALLQGLRCLFWMPSQCLGLFVCFPPLRLCVRSVSRFNDR
jgi:hypothetical protein